jgi:rare lipoprotein A
MVFKLSTFAAVCLGCALGATPVEALPKQTGIASWYGPGFHGRRTANGERFNTRALTAAHKTLPFNTKVEVKNARTGRAVVVRINDRGPFVKGRVIDLSKKAAEVVGISGIARVSLATRRAGFGWLLIVPQIASHRRLQEVAEEVHL